MIKITNEIDGKLYELVQRKCGCDECAFDGCSKCLLPKEHSYFNGHLICVKGIWKEVKDDEKKTK